MASNVFINEIHYDNANTDTGEFVEIAAAAGTDVTGWTIVLYNGSPSQRSSYSTTTLSGIIADQQNGFGTLRVTYPANGIQNGASGANGEPDGVALVDAQGNLVQFLSWEGSFVAASGPAAGLTSTNVGAGVYEDGTRNGTSIGLTGTGTTAADFQWAIIADDTPGAVNVGQTFGAGTPTPVPGTLSIGDATLVEGNTGTQEIVFTVTRAQGSAGAVSATWTLGLGTGSGAADATDFADSQATTGTVTFADGATTAEVRLAVRGDAVFEPTETFNVTLSGPTGGATLADAVATGTITNDDAAPPAPAANVFINEIHYDNDSTDAGEAIEIAGAAGTDLSGYRLVFYNGSNAPTAAPTYDTLNLSGTIDDEGNGFGAIGFNRAGIQNGAADGVALIAPDGSVIQLLSYEGTFTAAAGTPAAGVTSTDIGVSEEPAPAAGLSLQLQGTGSGAADFTWAAGIDDSFGTVNAGQSFLSPTGTGQLRVLDASVAEGDSGTTNLTFTVRRAGGTALAASVDYVVNLDGTASTSDLAPGATLSGTLTFAAGETSKQIVVPVAGDLVGEGNETLSVTLGATTGDVVITRATAIGTIVNDDPIALSIGQIQGEDHTSAYVGQTVITNGVVTAVDTTGFYLQSAVGDGNARTSDGIFVFTGTAPTVLVGDEATVRGSVTEYLGGAGSLTVTEIVSPTVTVASHDNAVPTAVLIGTGGLQPPSQVLDNDGLTSYDPTTDGLDFWESLEGMRVTLDTPQAVSNTNTYGETDVVVSLGVGATGVNDRGGITISPNTDGTVDYNPEKIQIDNSGVFGGFNPAYTIGDQLTSVTGIVNYAFANYEVLVTQAVTVTQDVTLAKETTALKSDANTLSIATYNLENLDTSDNKFDILADNIVYNLRAPDILAAQEIQDADGAGSGSDLSGTVTAQGLIDAIFAESGLRYAYVEVAPTTAGSSGGEPGGNIRTGFFYNIDRVSYVEGSAELITGTAYTNTRKPLVAQFNFAGQTITAIDVHFTSRLGSETLSGDSQPATNAGDAARTAQAAGVKAYIQDHLADDPSLNFALLGDFNGFYFEDAQTQLTDPAQGGVLTNLATLLPAEERYSYLFEGNAQLIDNILVTGGLVNNAQYDSVHLNSQFGGERPTDHDPQVALLRLGAAPTNLVLSNATVAENLPAGTVVGALSATDTVNDQLTYALVDNAGGLFAVDAATGVVTTTATLDYEAVATYAIVATATDTGGLATQMTFTVAVSDVNEGVALTAPSYGGTLNGTSGNDMLTGGAGSDMIYGRDGNDRLDGAGGRDTVDGGTGNDVIVYDASDYSIVGGLGSDTLVLRTAETVNLGNFSTSQVVGGSAFGFENVDASGATAPVTLNGSTYDNILIGGSGNDRIDGGGGPDFIDGGTGSDTIVYYADHNTINGGLGADTLVLRTGETVDLGDFRNSQIAGKSVFGFENVDASGSSEAVTLIGSIYDNVLVGGSGADTLRSGGGYDLLTGGAGADRFVFGTLASAATGQATITDLAFGDKIDLSGIDAVAGGANDPFAFIGTAAFGGVAGQLRYQGDAGGLIVQGDVDGDGVADFSILVRAAAIDASYFVL